MLQTWGATCGLCHPPVGYARANDRIEEARATQRSLSLGWLVIIETPDTGMDGSILPLDHPVVVITRHGAVAGVGGEVPLRDDFLSAGHASIKQTADLQAPFTIEDRREPGPSANGTFLNGRRLAGGEAAPLCDGDEIRVGATELAFRSLFVPGGRR